VEFVGLGLLARRRKHLVVLCSRCLRDISSLMGLYIILKDRLDWNKNKIKIISGTPLILSLHESFV